MDLHYEALEVSPQEYFISKVPANPIPALWIDSPCAQHTNKATDKILPFTVVSGRAIVPPTMFTFSFMGHFLAILKLNIDTDNHSSCLSHDTPTIIVLAEALNPSFHSLSFKSVINFHKSVITTYHAALLSKQCDKLLIAYERVYTLISKVQRFFDFKLKKTIDFHCDWVMR